MGTPDPVPEEPGGEPLEDDVPPVEEPEEPEPGPQAWRVSG